MFYVPWFLSFAKIKWQIPFISVDIISTILQLYLKPLKLETKTTTDVILDQFFF